MLDELYLGPEIRLTAAETPLLASFCREADLLSMWRGYGSGEFCIEFYSAVLLTEGVQVWQDLGMNKTEAEEAAIKNFPVSKAQFVDVIYGDVEGIHQKIRSSSDKRAALANSLIKVKHPAFSEERETQLVCFAASCMVGPPEVRAVRGQLIPL